MQCVDECKKGATKKRGKLMLLLLSIISVILLNAHDLLSQCVLEALDYRDIPQPCW